MARKVIPNQDRIRIDEQNKLKTYIPKKVSLSSRRMSSYEHDLPSGKKLVLNRTNPTFLITDKKDEAFIIKNLKGLILTSIDDKEFRAWIVKDILPLVNIEHTAEEVQKHVFQHPEESLIVKNLIEQGYIVTKDPILVILNQLSAEDKEAIQAIISKQEESETPEAPEEIKPTDKEPLEGVTQEPVVTNIEIPKAVFNLEDLDGTKEKEPETIISSPDPIDVIICSSDDLKSLSKLKELAAGRGYNGPAMRSKVDYIEIIKKTLQPNEHLPDENPTGSTN